MTVKNISKEEYYQLYALKILATNYNTRLEDIQRSMLEILRETKADGRKLLEIGDGWSGELVYTDINLDVALSNMKIEVENKNVE